MVPSEDVSLADEAELELNASHASDDVSNTTCALAILAGATTRLLCFASQVGDIDDVPEPAVDEETINDASVSNVSAIVTGLSPTSRWLRLITCETEGSRCTAATRFQRVRMTGSQAVESSTSCVGRAR